jgi:pyrimidine and pyridine-specific 5'-nucleotidase
MLNKLKIEEDQVPKMCLDLYKEYGTTMAGLKACPTLISAPLNITNLFVKSFCFLVTIFCFSIPIIMYQVLGYDFDYDDFHACVHGTLPYEKLKPDPVLRQLLLSLPQRKIVSPLAFFPFPSFPLCIASVLV